MKRKIDLGLYYCAKKDEPELPVDPDTLGFENGQEGVDEDEHSESDE